MNDPDRMAQLTQLFDDMGGTFALPDVLERIRDGRMQSFTDGDTWVVTQVVDFPRKKVMEVFLVVGSLHAVPRMSEQIEAAAREAGATLLRTYGRRGWERLAPDYGYTNGGVTVFFKDLERLH